MTVTATRVPGWCRHAWRTVNSWPDGGVALVVGAAQFLAAYAESRHGVLHHPWEPCAVALLAAGPVALLLRRQYPVAVLVVALSSSLAYAALGFGSGPLYISLVVALLTAIVAGHRWVAIASLAVGYAGPMSADHLRGEHPWPGLASMLGLAAWLAVLFAAGEALRVRKVRSAERAQVRDAESRRAVSDERLRIARELHDVLAHNISLINVQAGTALHRAERSEAKAYDALAIIKTVSQDILVEMRSLLGALREVDEAAPRRPTPTLSRLDDLVASAAAAGGAAPGETSGTPRALPAGVDLAAYRIVQEALTNVSRHSGMSTAEVRVMYDDNHLVVQVDDDGRGGLPVVPGTGITGMTERVTALGGQLLAGPQPSGGFRVVARIPMQSPA